jgi:hypothetical protein
MTTSSTLNVIIGRKRQIQVSTNATSGIIDSSTPLVLKNNPSLIAIGSGVERFDRLRDIDAAAEIEGAVPVYEANTDMYYVKKLDLDYITGEVDGGTF